MRSALWLISLLTFMVGLFDLPGHALNPFHPDEASASTSTTPQKPPHKYRRPHTSPIRLTPTGISLTTIQNFRTTSSLRMTRLVLDLDSKAHPSTRPLLQAEGVTIEIPNAILSPSAKTKLAAGRIVKPFLITQPSERSVHISLPTGTFTSY
ncbi:MAG: hypothetical protein ABI955_15525, partial [Nitrospirota bacterium]